MKLIVYIEVEPEPPAVDLEVLFRSVTTGEDAADFPSQVNLIYIDDARMRELNSKFREKDQTTDVMSFNIDEPETPDGVFGEIYISLPSAIRQADEFGVTVTDEIKRLFTHGLLHLFGYDHQVKQEAEKMFSTEERYLGLKREEN